MAASEASYPPDRHVLRDLRFEIVRDASGSRTLLPLTSWLRGPRGGVRAGPLAMLCDIAAGEGAIRAVRPDWVATSDLVLHVLRPLSPGVVVARPALLRRTRQTAVVEVTVAGDGAAEGAEPLALATLTFAVLPARGGAQRMGTGSDEPHSQFALPGSGLTAPLAEALGVRVVDAASGALEVPVTPYMGNSLGALQGGVVAMLAELAAEAAGGAALGRPVAVVDLAINFLGLLRAGPARTCARLLRCEGREGGAGEALLRVELRDAGSDERLCTVATALVRG